jgi:hypothetical protein
LGLLGIGGDGEEGLRESHREKTDEIR